ncbi:hypothetical protein POM88_054218 [Heracleum sosnowskyi]|uniref:TF-B3 domain-containing protein n=1 Tax=Heracleum sosnowskyi TaxID=360622 RepID=A0AAD8GN26_9APIA|nr:hypothetical protein POM88_054218 [Heracleum sosnowskyi]
MLLFDNGWHAFVKTMNIRKDDVLVFQSTSHHRKYEISLFEKKIIGKYMRIEGNGRAHIINKWFKILNEATVYTREMEIPRKYVDNYGWTVGEHVKLVITDEREYCVKFWLGKNVLYGLSYLVERYSLSKNYVLVFTYLEISTFSVELFDPNNMKITMAGRDNLDVVLYHNSESVGTTASRNIALPENTVDERINEFEFTVIIKDSHIDQEGHGIVWN